ncbi:MAG: PQQ-like beta-propeller repeat protein [Gemmataceae bacterium]|nr:PQQ-like beta-propeller repeat protein [Gemmataceae bacterium]MCI0743475.1 PQQ-like beta-propeller repeat protein [Gemmataceae bacterium]
MRRTGILLLVFCCTGSNLHAQGSDWPQFLGPKGTSVSTEKGIIAPWPEKGLRVVWHRKLGTGYGAPSISKGKLFQLDRVVDQIAVKDQIQYFETNTARLVCLDARTGRLQWKFEYQTDFRDYFGYNNGPRSCPVVDGDRVYIYGAEGLLHCVSTEGKLLWKVDTRKDFGMIKNFFGVGSAPVVEGDLVLVNVGGSPPGSKEGLQHFADLKGNGSGVVAFDKYKGTVQYKISDELASYASPVLATIDGRRWCFMLARGGLLAFEPKSGKIDFHFPWRAEDFESVNASNPVVVGNQVLITECYGPGSALLEVKPGGYDVVWDDAKKFRKSLQCHWMTPIHHNGYVYGSSGRHTNHALLRSVEWATGKVMWSEPRLSRCSLLMVDGHFICLGEDGKLRLLKVNSEKYDEVSVTEVVRDPKTGEPILEYPCWAAPVLSNGLLYVRGDDRLVCLELIPQK